MWDVTVGLIKPMFFGGAIAIIGCHRGFHSGAGAEGVGRAATRAFVASFIAILVLDFFLALFLNNLYDLLWPTGGRACCEIKVVRAAHAAQRSKRPATLTPLRCVRGSEINTSGVRRHDRAAA